MTEYQPVDHADTLREHDLVEIYHIVMYKIEDARVVESLGDVFRCVGVNSGRTVYVRKARAKIPRSNGVYDIVKKRSSRWVKVDSSPSAFVWAFDARRPVGANASAEPNK